MRKTKFFSWSLLVITISWTSPLFGQVKIAHSQLGEVKFTPTGELDIQASATSSQNDFDFLVGKWKLKDKKLKSRLTNSNEWIEFESTVEHGHLQNHG